VHIHIGRLAKRTVIVASLTAGLLAALCCGSADALLGRGFVFGGSFEGAGAQGFAGVDGVAVDDASGAVYVVDAGHERVEWFTPSTGGYEFAGEVKVPSPGAIAIDNSASAADPSRGDVYVVGAEEKGEEAEERDYLYKFTANGEKIFKKSIFKAKDDGEEVETELEDISGVAVDAQGRLWAYWEEEGLVSGFSDAEHNQLIPSLSKELPLESLYECRAGPEFAVSADAEYLYAGHERENALEECPFEELALEEAGQTLVAKVTQAGQVLAKGLDNQDTTGVAVDQESGEVFADNADGIAAFDGEGALIERFGEGQLQGGGAIAVDDRDDTVFVAESQHSRIAIFTGETAGAPRIDSVQAEHVAANSERLSARIDPHGADTHYYFLYGQGDCASEPSACTQLPSPAADAGDGYGDRLLNVQVERLQSNTTYSYTVVAENSYGTVRSAHGQQTFFTTLPSSEGTLADSREWELVSPAEKHGAAVEPISREGALIQASSGGDALAWTASSPVSGEAAQGNRTPEPVEVLSRRGGEGWSSEDIGTPHDRGEGINTGEASEYRYFTPDLAFALVQPQVPSEPIEDPPLAETAREKTLYRRNDQSQRFEPLVSAEDDTTGVAFGGRLEFEGATPSLEHVLFGSEVGLLAGAGEAGLYEWTAGAPALSLVSRLPQDEGGGPASEPELGFAGRDVRGAISQDGSRVFWTNGREEGPLYMRNTASGETIQVNAAHGSDEPSEEEREEGVDEVYFQGASGEGERVFFTDTWPLTGESALEPVAREEVIEEPPAGTRSTGRAADLYEYDAQTGKLTDLTVDQHIGEPADALGTIPGISENGEYVYFVANGVLAPGAGPGDCPRTKPLLPHPEDLCNLYLSKPIAGGSEGRETVLVARLSAQDAGDWSGANSPLPGDLGGLTSQVSANGRYLAFMSDQPLTGYDNQDVNPLAAGDRDEEVYLYDAATEKLVCASCNPDGQPPTGVYDAHEAGEGLGLVVDRPETWTGDWLAGSLPGWTLFELNNPRAQHQSRYLSNSGRLFFNSADPLLPQVTARTRSETVNGSATTVGVENVYQYEPAGEGSCASQPGCVSLISSGTSEHESAFLDASETGNDAFFLTSAQLVAQDSDDSPDIYDARVCGTTESEPCLLGATPPAPACASGEACRPAQTPQTNYEPPPTAGYSGPGNQPDQQVNASKTTAPPELPKPLTSRQKLTRALRSCRKLKRHKRRVACERSARRRYRPVKKRKKTR
jgi:DNA-binding beta-propeller fold protein YncE